METPVGAKKTSSSLRPEEEKLCVLYRGADGKIVHTHRVTTLPGGRRLNDAEVERRARELAARRHPDRHLAQRELKALHVNPEDFQHGVRYRVDLEAGKLVSASEFAGGRNSD
jgi:hypothetical protein